MKISSPAFEQSQLNPAEHPHDRGDVTPPLHLENAVFRAKTPVLIINDLEAPAGKWVRPITRSIDSMKTETQKNSVPAGAQFGTNHFKNQKMWPLPARSGIHRYFFKLNALDRKLDITESSTKTILDRA
jgi:hypothetical protein